MRLPFGSPGHVVGGPPPLPELEVDDATLDELVVELELEVLEEDEPEVAMAPPAPGG